MEDSAGCTYKFDVLRNEIVSDCTLCPTNVLQAEYPFLYAKNNKYDTNSVDPGKIGKWLLFLSRDSVNAAWDKIKVAIANGDLWSAKVSTSSGVGVHNHVIMVYTKDFTDLNDVISVLDFLENSRLKKPANKTIYYKTEEQTAKRIYSGGGQRPWIYASNTIRLADDQEEDDDIRPSEMYRKWLVARNSTDIEYVDDRFVGKWLLFLSEDEIDDAWDKIKIGVRNGDLWSAKTSASYHGDPSYVVKIYTKDYNDLDDVIRVLDYLENSEIKPSDTKIYYKTEEQTRAGIYHGDSTRPWIYSSDTIRD